MNAKMSKDKAAQDRPVPVGLRLRPSLKERLDIVAAERGVYNYEVLGDALEAYFGRSEEEPESLIPTKLRPYMAKLAKVLSSGNEFAIEAVIRILDVAVKQAEKEPRTRG